MSWLGKDKQQLNDKINILNTEIKTIKVKNKSKLDNLVLEKEKELIRLNNLVFQSEENKKVYNEELNSKMAFIDDLKSKFEQEKSKMDDLNVRNNELCIEVERKDGQIENYKVQKKYVKHYHCFS